MNTKFVLAFENSVCNDYVTEKIYDVFAAGVVPIYLGAPNIDEIHSVTRFDCARFGIQRYEATCWVHKTGCQWWVNPRTANSLSGRNDHCHRSLSSFCNEQREPKPDLWGDWSNFLGPHLIEWKRKSTPKQQHTQTTPTAHTDRQTEREIVCVCVLLLLFFLN